jgi:hypothetical protein
MRDMASADNGRGCVDFATAMLVTLFRHDSVRTVLAVANALRTIHPVRRPPRCSRLPWWGTHAGTYAKTYAWELDSVALHWTHRDDPVAEIALQLTDYKTQKGFFSRGINGVDRPAHTHDAAVFAHQGRAS